MITKIAATTHALSTVAAIDAPRAVAADPAGNIYVAEPAQIDKIAAGTGTVSVLATGFTSLAAIAYHPDGVLFVADPADPRVRAVDPVTGTVTDAIGRAGRYGIGLGPLPGGLNQPDGLAILPSGDLAIADRQENVIVVARAPTHVVAQ